MMTFRVCFVAVLNIFATVASAQTKDDLVGTWRLVSAWTTRPNGERTADYGKHPVGFITYTPEGRMMAINADGDRKPLSGDRLSAPVSERAEAFSNFLAYAGWYEVKGSQVIHHVEVASIPNWVNTGQVRRIRLEGNRLTIAATNMLGGEQREIELVYVRSR